jgi:hypothetical protein
MNSIELITATFYVIVVICIGFMSYVLLRQRKEQIKPKEQVATQASLLRYDETEKLKARIEYLELQVVSFSNLCNELTIANTKYLDYFEEYIKLSENK